MPAAAQLISGRARSSPRRMCGPSWSRMRRTASSPARRSGSACRSHTSPSGTPTGRTPAIPACRQNSPGRCLRACRTAISPGRCRRRFRSATWPTTVMKAPCCCRCRSPSHPVSILSAAPSRYDSRRRGWSAARNAFPRTGSFCSSCRCRGPRRCTRTCSMRPWRRSRSRSCSRAPSPSTATGCRSGSKGCRRRRAARRWISS